MTTALFTAILATMGFVIVVHVRVSRLAEHVVETRGDVKVLAGAIDTLSVTVDDLREEVRTGFAAIRDEFATVSSELNTGFASVRQEMAEGDRGVSGEIADIRERLARLEAAPRG